MNEKLRFWLFLGFYLLVTAGGFLILWLGGLGTSWNIVIALAMVCLSAYVSYTFAHPKKKK
ncbi:MAG TPA: hypothetical protein P5154_02540 [Candidatus Izemoplasmatales bacterium]|nr:hypothetical protein [Bacillota bacterium]HRY77623.1 hypothetical protein [Candidatus Izemoplasmatales bacterium]